MKVQQTFKDVADGYGFDEIEQAADGTFCEACLTVHKRPTKMYSNDPVKRRKQEEVVMCRWGILRFYGDQE